MRTMVRLKTKDLDWGAELIGVMLDKFDAALVVQLAAFRRSAIEIKAFWGTHRDICALVVDAPRFDKILEKDEAQLDEVAADVAAVTQTSQLGQKMFGWAAPYVVSSRMVKHLVGELERLQPPILKDKIEKITTASLKELDLLKGEEILATRRKVVLVYRKIPVEITVVSWAQEMQRRMAAALKTYAVDNGKLDEMSFEAGMFGAVDAAPVEVDKELLVQYAAVRKTVEEMVGASRLTGGVITDLLSQRAQALNILCQSR